MHTRTHTETNTQAAGAMANQPKWDAKTIKNARNAKNIKQVEMAESLGCRQQTVSDWELGYYTPKNAYQKLLSMYFER